VGTLIRPFLQLCALRLRPQDLPVSGTLLGISLAAYAMSTILVSTVQLAPGQAVLAGLVDTGLLCAMTASLLALQRLGARLLQTLTALAGASTVLTVVAYPFFHMARGGLGPGVEAGLPGAVVGILVLWSFAVFAHILRHALSAPFVVGLAVAVMFYLVSSEVLVRIFALGA
jgi:hypothetical protein